MLFRCAICIQINSFQSEDHLLVNCTFFSKNPDLSMEEEEGQA